MDNINNCETSFNGIVFLDQNGDVVPDIENALEVEERLQEIKEAQYNGQYGAKRKAQTIESLLQRIDKQKKQIEKLKKRPVKGTKIKIVYVTNENGNIYK